MVHFYYTTKNKNKNEHNIHILFITSTQRTNTHTHQNIKMMIHYTPTPTNKYFNTLIHYHKLYIKNIAEQNTIYLIELGIDEYTFILNNSCAFPKYINPHIKKRRLKSVKQAIDDIPNIIHHINNQTILSNSKKNTYTHKMYKFSEQLSELYQQHT